MTNRKSHSLDPDFNGYDDMVPVDQRRQGLGSGGPYAPRRSKGTYFEPDFPQYNNRQQAEIDRLSNALFDRNEIGTKDRWMRRRR